MSVRHGADALAPPQRTASATYACVCLSKLDDFIPRRLCSMASANSRCKGTSSVPTWITGAGPAPYRAEISAGDLPAGPGWRQVEAGSIPAPTPLSLDSTRCHLLRLVFSCNADTLSLHDWCHYDCYSVRVPIRPGASAQRNAAAAHPAAPYASRPWRCAVLTPTPPTEALLTMIRDKDTPRADFIFYSDRVIRLIVEEGLNHLPTHTATITTPTGSQYQGLAFEGHICGVSILRAGEAMEAGLRECCRSVRIGKILIQRDEATAQPKLFYAKLPKDINDRWVLLLDPMLATGGSAMQAMQVLLDHGVRPDRILFLNVLASPEGLQAVYKRFPQIKVISAWVDESLDSKSYIRPGLGDFGDRYYSAN